MRLQIKIPKLNPARFFGLFLALYWGQNIFFSYVRAVFLRIPYIKYLADYIFPCLIIACLILAIPYFEKIIRAKDFLFFGSVVIIFLLNLILFPENESLMSIMGAFFVSVFPMYFIGLSFEPSRHFRILNIMSIINIWTFAVYNLFINSNRLEGVQGTFDSYMGRAYVLLPQLLVVICSFLREKNIWNAATGVIGIILLLMCGNRGSVAILLLFILLNILFNSNKKRRVYVYVGALSIFVILLYFYQNVTVFLMELFSKLGMSVRVFERLSDGTFFESNARIAILDKLKSAIVQNPIIGYGLCSDRTICGSYAHNYAYELWTAFGVILGSIVLIATIYVIIIAWIKSEDVESRGFLFILLCVGFFKLFISSSFLLEGLFFMLMGYCVMLLRRNKFMVSKLGGDTNENL